MTAALCLRNGSPRPEIVDHFGAASYETQNVESHWRHGGVLYRDDLVRSVIDVSDQPKNRQWMKQFKKRWKDRLEQLALWVISTGSSLGHQRDTVNCPHEKGQ